MEQSPERWKSVVGYEGVYEVSDRGRVRSLPRYDSRGYWWCGQILKPYALPSTGHRAHILHWGGLGVGRSVGRLVLEAFVEPMPFPEAEADHVDHDPTNNRPENLRWLSTKENMRCRRCCKLDLEKARKIRSLFPTLPGSKAARYRRLAKRFGVRPMVVGRVVAGYTWREEPGEEKQAQRSS